MPHDEQRQAVALCDGLDLGLEPRAHLFELTVDFAVVFAEALDGGDGGGGGDGMAVVGSGEEDAARGSGETKRSRMRLAPPMAAMG